MNLETLLGLSLVLGYSATSLENFILCIIDSSIGRVLGSHNNDSRFESCDV